MTTPSEDVGEGWRKGDKTSQGLDAYELLARQHRAAQAEIESLAAQLIHRTQQRDNQTETIRELTAVNDERAAALAEARHLITTQTARIESLTEAVDAQERGYRLQARDQEGVAAELRAKVEVAERRVTEARGALRLVEQENDKLRAEQERGAEVIIDLRAQVENANRRVTEAESNATRLAAANDDLNKQLDRQRQISANAVSDSGRVPNLLSALDQIQKAVLGTLEVTSDAGSGVQKVAEIRRKQRLKYTVEHDAEHGLGDLVDAADALIHRDNLLWPDDFDDSDFRRITRLPETRYAHAAALLCAALDVIAFQARQAHDSAS